MFPGLLLIVHDGSMTWDWDRLGRLLKARRAVLDMTQQQLADRAGVSIMTIRNLENGREFKRPPQSIKPVERELGWKAGSALAILQGGEPTPLEPADRSQRVLHEGDMDPSKPLSERLPTSVMHALEGREVYATDTYDLTLGGGLTLVAVVVRDPDAPGHPKDFERLRRENRAWLNAQHKLRNLPPLEWEPGDPEEWKADSGTGDLE